MPQQVGGGEGWKPESRALGQLEAKWAGRLCPVSLVGPPPSCTGTNSASNRDSHSESATTKEHRRFFVTSVKYTHGDDTWHLYTTVFLLMRKPQIDSSKKRQEQRVLCNLSHIIKKCSNSARQLIQRACMSKQSHSPKRPQTD